MASLEGAGQGQFKSQGFISCDGEHPGFFSASILEKSMNQSSCNPLANVFPTNQVIGTKKAQVSGCPQVCR